MLKREKNKNIIFWVSILTLLFILHFFQGRLNSDDGIFLSGAWSILNNFSLYKDFFSFTAPGSYYFLVFIWKLFGLSYWLVWMIALGFIFISAIFVFEITKRFNKVAAYKGTAYLAVLLFILFTVNWPIITSHTFCLPFLLGAIYLTLVWLDGRRPSDLCWVGLLTGFAFLFLQTLGLAILATVIVFLFINSFREKKAETIKNILRVTTFFCLPLLPLFIKWSPIFLFNNLIKFPFYNYSATLTFNYKLVVINFLFLSIFLLLLKINKSEPKGEERVSLLFIWQLFLFFTVFSYPDFTHISFVSAPLLIIFSIVATERTNKEKKYWRATRLITVLSFIYYFIFYFYFSCCLLDYSQFFVSNKKASLISFVKENCQTEYIYAGPFLPQIYFFTNKLNPGPSHWLFTKHHPDEYFIRTRQALEEKKPDCVVLNYEMVKKFNYNKNNELDNYILANYHLFKQVGDIFILKR